jgi:hypothetical protein
MRSWHLRYHSIPSLSTKRPSHNRWAGDVMSHHFQLRSSVPLLRFFPGGLGARFSRNEPKHLGCSGGSVGVAVASPSRTLQRHRAEATAKEVGVQETAQGSAALGWAARDASGVLSPFDFSRRCVSCRLGILCFACVCHSLLSWCAPLPSPCCD